MIQGFVRSFVRIGRLTYIDARGRATQYGDGTGPQITARLKPGAMLRIMRRPTLAIGECYTDGSLSFEQGDIYAFLDLIGRNFAHDPARRPRYGWSRRAWFGLQRRLAHLNDTRAARRNVAHHYDLSTELYRRFLDADMQYSCAYFARPDMTLEEAQAAKKAHIAAKLLLRPGLSVLDIGCGWGGLALTLAHIAEGVRVQGITLSDEQLAVARGRAEAAGLAERVRFDLTDYRELQGAFDRIVSVGMFEHVGRPQFQTYFDRIAALLAEDGVAVVHAIGRRSEPGVTNPWMSKYIFPGGYIPALSETIEAVERSGLWVTDVEVLRVHYAETLRAWRERFDAQREEIAALFDEQFCRMWEYYLAASEIAFRHGGFMVFQLQLARSQTAVPLTRDYLAQAEREAAEAASAA